MGLDGATKGAAHVAVIKTMNRGNAQSCMCRTACVSSHRWPKASLLACLGVGDVMNGCDAAVLDAQLLMDHLLGGSWAEQVWVGAEGQAQGSTPIQERAGGRYGELCSLKELGNSGSTGGRKGVAWARSHARLPAHLDYGSQAVGGAGGRCDDVVVGCAVQVLQAGMGSRAAAQDAVS